VVFNRPCVSKATQERSDLLVTHGFSGAPTPTYPNDHPHEQVTKARPTWARHPCAVPDRALGSGEGRRPRREDLASATDSRVPRSAGGVASPQGCRPTARSGTPSGLRRTGRWTRSGAWGRWLHSLGGGPARTKGRRPNTFPR
jgi:hypothetical protein